MSGSQPSRILVVGAGFVGAAVGAAMSARGVEAVLVDIPTHPWLADRDAASRAIGLHERIASCERRTASVEARLEELGRKRIGREEAEAAFADFDGIWRAMTPWERRRVARLLIERVDYDDEAESIEVTFRPDSIRAFADRALEEAA